MHAASDELSQTIRILSDTPERRQTNRRRLKGSAVLSIPDRGILCGDMVDIGTGGFSIIVATQLECGQGCRVVFSIRLGMQKIPIDCIGVVVNSVCVTQGFRLGMRFIVTDIREQRVIERYLEEGQNNAYSDITARHKVLPEEPNIHLDPPAVVNFRHEDYPKTVRISDLGKR